MIYDRWVTVLQYIMVVMNLGMIYLGWIGDDSICFVHFLQMVWTWLLDSIISCEFGRGVRKPVQFTDDDCVRIVNSCKDSTNRVVFFYFIHCKSSIAHWVISYPGDGLRRSYSTSLNKWQLIINSWFDFILYQLLPSGLWSRGHKTRPEKVTNRSQKHHSDEADKLHHARTSMGIAGSRDDLIAFLNANSSKEWRSQKGDRRNLWSAKDENGWNKYYIGWDSLSMHVNANPRKCQKVVQPPGLTTNQQQWLEAWQHLRAHTLAKLQHIFAIILWVPLLTHMRGISVVPFGHAWKRSWY